MASQDRIEGLVWRIWDKVAGVLAGRFISAPDVTLKNGGAWWDVTTEAQRGAHLDKYAGWGLGYVLTY